MNVSGESGVIPDGLKAITIKETWFCYVYYLVCVSIAVSKLIMASPRDK